jgi:hypothetical protein
MQKLLGLVDKLAFHIQNANLVNNNISDVNIGWHIEHACLVIIKITETIKQSDAEKFSSKFNFKKHFVFFTGKFPRGRAKAPNVVIPKGDSDEQHLMMSIESAKDAIQVLNKCVKNQFFQHPIFGNLNQPQTFHFLAIHTTHHLKIIEDIVNGTH